MEDIHCRVGILALVSPFAQIFVPFITDRHCSVVFAILEVQDAASDHMAMQILGHICMACAAMTFTFSSLLTVAFRAHRVDLEAQDGVTNISPLFIEPTGIPFPWWNIYVLMALPAVSTA